MPGVYDSNNDGLMGMFVRANEEEGQATKDLLAYMQGGSPDQAILMQLQERFEECHNRKMAIYAQLQKYRLDK